LLNRKSQRLDFVSPEFGGLQYKLLCGWSEPALDEFEGDGFSRFAHINLAPELFKQLKIILLPVTINHDEKTRRFYTITF